MDKKVVVGLTQILDSLVEEVKLSVSTHVTRGDLLHSLLNAPWLHSLFKVYERLQWHTRVAPSPYILFASGLSHQVMADLQRIASPSPEARELHKLLRDSHLLAFLSAHDTVAQKDFEPVLPPLPNNLPNDEEAMKIVCLVKNNQPLGATIKRNELTGEIFVARVIHGGLADRSGLLYAGDKIIEVNGQPVEGLEPEQIIQKLAKTQGTIMFKVVPMSDRPVNSQMTIYVRAMINYSPYQDPTIPCADAGMAFCKGDVLEIVDQADALWWQARKMTSNSAFAGLIPSTDLLRRKQREIWWSQPSQQHTCTTSLSDFDKDEDLDEGCFDEEKAECSRNSEGVHLAGFRHSLYRCQKKSRRFRMRSCYSHCLSRCYSSLVNPYEEVVRYLRHPQDKPRLIVLTGPPGMDINELRRRLIAINPKEYQGPVPHTTRPLKCFEKSGREYHFISTALFENMLYNHRFLEYGEYQGHLYGMSISAIRSILDTGKICIVDIDLHGLQAIRTQELKAYVIYLKSSSVACIKQTHRNAKVSDNCYDNQSSRNEECDETEEAAKMESHYCQFFDKVIVDDRPQDFCRQLLVAIRQAQDEPQWVPASWLCSMHDS